MAVNTIKSSHVTNHESNDGSWNDLGKVSNGVKCAIGKVAYTTGDLEVGDIAHVLALPSNARLLSLVLKVDDLDSNASPALLIDVGLYNGDKKFEVGGTSYTINQALDIDVYADGSSKGQAADTVGSDISTVTRNITSVGNMLWEDAGLASDPHATFYVSVTISAAPATAAAGDLTLVAQYIV